MLNEGFAEYKPNAINLLKTTVNILNEFDINHFLISGTLLGFVRHNDFIPWDDDIDLLVDESLLDNLSDISKKYPNINIFRKTDHKYDSIKFCFSDGIEIPENKSVIDWKKNCISQDNRYCWPFIDLFIYEMGPGLHNCSNHYNEELVGNNPIKVWQPFSGQCSECFRLFSESEMSFFHNDWQISEFFPPKRVNLLGVDCNIPKNPDYFLNLNYGPNYMTEIKPPTIIHKTEEIIKND
jgi:phosphorylcholine metabolism protein LicD